MKLFAAAVMCIALYFLYRIAFPKQPETKTGKEIPTEKPKSLPDVMGKSRFVLPDRSKPLQTPATSQETEKEVEKEPIFAAKTEEERSVAIPAEQFDEVFDDNSNPEIMSVPLEDDNDEVDFEAEEAEELGRVLGYEPILAEGMDYDNLQTVVKVVKEQPDKVNEETGRTIAALEHTDMFEMLASGNEGKMNWIKSIVARHIQDRISETENVISDIDYGNFDVADMLD